MIGKFIEKYVNNKLKISFPFSAEEIEEREYLIKKIKGEINQFLEGKDKELELSQDTLQFLRQIYHICIKCIIREKFYYV